MFQNIFSKMTTITNLEFFQSILSFLNAVFCVYFMYKYNETKDLIYFRYTTYYVIIPFLIIDLALNVYLIMNKTEKKSCVEAVFHHIITFFLSIWGYFIGMYHTPDVVYNLVMFESSSIFLNIRFWIREYLKAIDNKPIPKLVTILQNVNEALFTIYFIYFRCYVFLKDIIFNKSVYETLIGSGIFVNKIFIGVIFVFLLLNFYWSFIICKSGCKKTINIIQEKIQTDYVDDEIILIEKIKVEIINSRLNDKC